MTHSGGAHSSKTLPAAFVVAIVWLRRGLRSRARLAGGGSLRYS